MTKDEALKMAIEALENAQKELDGQFSCGNCYTNVIQACKEALEQRDLYSEIKEGFDALKQPAQEPVYIVKQNGNCTMQLKSKDWVGLSDDEIWDIANFLGKNKEWDYPVMFAKTIEKALKEKNKVTEQ